MPYIRLEDRDLYDESINDLASTLEEQGWVAGHLNYAISRLCGRMFRSESRYKTICVVIGTLFCVAFEFYRRKAAPYEDTAIHINGDIEEYFTYK